MNWNNGLEARYYASFVDKDTWRDMERFEITGGGISRSTDDLIESADIQTTNYTQGEKWIRVWMDARQNGANEHIALFTGLATSPMTEYDGDLASMTLECYSVLKPMQDVLLPRGWYVLSGTGIGVIKDLLRVTPAPYEIADNMPTLANTIIAEDGETNLTMLVKIVNALGWRIRITGRGVIQICPHPTKESASFGLDNDSVEPVYKKSYDWFKCPNVFKATDGETSAVAVDDSEYSELSTINRGREIWAEDSSVNLNSNETLYDYALRRLKESQRIAQRVSYDRRYNPDVLVGDIVRLNYKNINGLYYVISQRIELGYEAKTTEEVAR